jgi:hypothetical protein
MADLLWQKPGVAVDAKIQTFLAGDDVILDREFFLYDVAASKAHAQGLENIGILDTAERTDLQRELDVLAEDFRSGAFVLDERFEDCHSAIEARLTERLGDAGRKIHTGRSRNDQILVATRLWLKDKLSASWANCAARSRPSRSTVPKRRRTCRCRATRTCSARWCPRRACGGPAGPKPSSTTRTRAADTFALVDANPLGTAAGYGVNLPLDRATMRRTRWAFARMQISPMYAQLSRGKFELAALEALEQRDARPAPPRMGPVACSPVREYSFVATACAIHDRQLDHAEQAQSRCHRTDARYVRQRGRRAHRDRAAAVAAVAATTATCRSARAPSSTASARGWARCRCCPTCCATWTGTPTACARHWSRRCTRPTSRWILRSRACRSAMRTSRRPTPRAGPKAIRRRAWRRAHRRAGQGTCD